MKKLFRLALGWVLIVAILTPSYAVPAVQAQGIVDISTAQGLQDIAGNPTGSYQLVADIDLSTIPNWTPLGTTGTPFDGTLNGNGHAIRNMVLADTQTDNQGLFGVTGSNAFITDLRIENASVTAADYAGILAGVNNGWLNRVSSQGVIIGGRYVGGLVGDNYGIITQSFAIATVTGRDVNGGLVGRNNAQGILTDTYAAATVAGAVTNTYVEFSGDDYISIPHIDDYVTDSFTLEAWIQMIPDPNDTDGVDFITGKGLENFEIHTRGADGIRFIPVYRPLTYYGDGRAYQDVPGVLRPGWNHVAAVWDYLNKQAMVLLNGIPQHIIQDGVDVGTVASIPLKTPGTNPLAGNANAFFIGARNDNGGQPFFNFHGYISDVRFWKTVRTPTQISADKYKQLNGDEPNLIGYWKLNEGSGSVVADSSSKRNDGAILGTPGWQNMASVNGGLVAVNDGAITDGYYDSTLFPHASPDATGLPTAMMMQQSSLGGLVFGPGDWRIVEGRTYPTLFTYDPAIEITSIGPSPAMYGQSYFVSASVGPHYIGTITGMVTGHDGEGNFCQAALAPGSPTTPSTGSCALGSDAGTKTVTASYEGNDVFAPVSATASQTVSKVAQDALTITAPNWMVFGSIFELSASGGSGTGGITFSAGGSTGCSVSGSTLSVTNASGTCLVTATRAGDNNYDPITSAPSSVTLIKTGSTTTITGDGADPSVYGEKYTVSASVTGAGAAPTGAVAVSDGTGGSCTIDLADGQGSCQLTSSGVSDVTLTASYSGDDNYEASGDTEAHSRLVGQTEVTLTGDTPDPSAPGVAVTFSASVSAVAPAAGTPTGTVDVLLGSTELCSSTLLAGQASCTFSLSTSTEALTVRYDGDAYFAGSTSAPAGHSVAKVAQGFLFVNAPDSLFYGTSAALSAFGGSGTGEITYSAGESTGCSVSGSTLSVTNASGTCLVTATRAGDTTYEPITSQAVFVMLLRASSTTTITGDGADPSVYGEKYTVSASVTGAGAAPTGAVTVSDGTGGSCTITLVDGQGSCQLTSSGVSDVTVTATYDGDDNYEASGDTEAHSRLVGQTEVTLTGDTPDPSAPGVAVTFSASVVPVAPAAGTPTGTVDVLLDSTVLCSSTLLAGQATCTYSGLSVGSHTLTARYSGDASFAGSTSAPAGHSVVKGAQEALTVNAPASLVYGASAELSASGGSGTGEITYSAGVSTGCSVSGSTLSVTNAAGTCSVTATKAGDGEHDPITSDPVTIALLKAAPTVTIASDSADPSAFGQDYTISVSVTGAGDAPTGAVTVSDGEGQSCTIDLVDGTGSCALPTTGVGEVTVTASYAGDGNYTAASSARTHTRAAGQTETILTGDTPDPSAPDEAVTFSVSVSAVAPAAGIPTGTVDVLRSTAAEGQPVDLADSVLCSATLLGGEASCTYGGGLSTGRHTLRARYSGDGSFAVSTSGPATHSAQTIALDDDRTSTGHASVGQLTTDGGSSPYTYRLQTGGRVCTPANGADNDGFAVNGAVLERRAGTGAGVYAVCVESEDAGGGLIQHAFAIFINDPPTLGAGSLSRLTVASTATEVGQLSVTGGRAPFAYGLAASGAVCTAQNAAGNAGFEFSGAALTRRSATPAGAYPICVQVTDAEGDLAQQAYTITVSDGPQALALSRTKVSSRQSEVGAFSVEAGLAPIAYSLATTGAVCTPDNGADNAAFAVDGSTLKRQAGTGSGSYAVCAQAEDANGVVTQAAFTIGVTPPPANLQLSNQTVKVGQALVGTLSTASGLLPYAYSLETSGAVCTAANGGGNASFEVEGNALKRRDATPAGAYSVCLQTADGNGEVFQKVFVIAVTPAAPPPPEWSVELTANQIIESDPIGTVVGTLVSNRSAVTYTLADLDAFPLADHFTINAAGELLLAKTLAPDTPSTFPIRIRATLAGGTVRDVDGVITVMKDGAAAGAAAEDDSGDLEEGATLRVDVLANDQVSGGATSWRSMQIVRYPQHGSARLGSIIYTPAAGFYGTDSVTYRACDDLGYCVTGTVDFTVAHVPQVYYWPRVWR